MMRVEKYVVFSVRKVTRGEGESLLRARKRTVSVRNQSLRMRTVGGSWIGARMRWVMTPRKAARRGVGRNIAVN